MVEVGSLRSDRIDEWGRPSGAESDGGAVPGFVSEAYQRFERAGAPCAPDSLQLHARFDNVHSTVLIFRPSRESCPGIAVKWYRHSRAEEQPAESEHLTLQLLRDVFSATEHLAVPRTLGVGDDGAALIMEEVRGDSVDQVVSDASRFSLPGTPPPDRTSSALTACRLAGEWLARFQSAGLGADDATHRPQDGDLAAAGCQQLRLREALDRLRRQAPSISDILPSMRHYFFDSMIMQGAGPRVSHHPDYAPYNMIMSDDRLTVLDFSEVGPGHPMEAAAFFWASLEIRSILPWTDGSLLHRCQESFWEAFAGSSAPSPFWTRWGLVAYVSYLRPASQVFADRTSNSLPWPARQFKRAVHMVTRRLALKRLMSEDWKT